MINTVCSANEIICPFINSKINISFVIFLPFRRLPKLASRQTEPIGPLKSVRALAEETRQDGARVLLCLIRNIFHQTNGPRESAYLLVRDVRVQIAIWVANETDRDPGVVFDPDGAD